MALMSNYPSKMWKLVTIEQNRRTKKQCIQFNLSCLRGKIKAIGTMQYCNERAHAALNW